MTAVVETAEHMARRYALQQLEREIEIEDTPIYHARKPKHYLGKYLVGSECTYDRDSVWCYEE